MAYGTLSETEKNTTTAMITINRFRILLPGLHAMPIRERSRFLKVFTHKSGHSLGEKCPILGKLAVRIIRHCHIRDKKSRNAIVLKVDDCLDIGCLCRLATGISVDD